MVVFMKYMVFMKFRLNRVVKSGYCNESVLQNFVTLLAYRNPK